MTLHEVLAATKQLLAEFQTGSQEICSRKPMVRAAAAIGHIPGLKAIAAYLVLVAYGEITDAAPVSGYIATLEKHMASLAQSPS